ncbi:MAG: VCBS repeat-containing protein [Gemmataceae bacterium]
MAKNWWTKLVGRNHVPVRRPAAAFRPQLNTLEDKVTPTLVLGTLTVTPDNPGTPGFVNEGDTVTLTTTYTAVNTIGDVSLTINWGDGTTTSTPVAFGTNLPLTVQHRYVNNIPTGSPQATETITANLSDSGPSVLLNPGAPQAGRYYAYDVAGLDINLGDAFAALGAASGVSPVSALDNNSTSSATVTTGGSFTFYGKQYSAVNLSKNGLIAFDGTNTSGNNGPLTSTTPPALIAPFWDDLVTGVGVNSRVFTKSLDVTGDGVADWFIIEWHNVQHSPSSPSSATFQALLQLGTGATVNGDVIFNYVDTDFGDPAINYGASASVGIKSGFTAGPPAVGTPQTGNAVITPGRTRTGDGQAIRFSTTQVAVSRISGPNTFGYSAFRMPFESTLNLINPAIAPAPSNGNFSLLGGAGSFTDEEASPNSGQVGNAAFTYYGIVTQALNLIVSGHGYTRLPGTGPNPPATNTNLATSPQAALIASLWDDWIGPNPPTSQVIGRLIDIDGDVINVTTDANKAEFLVIEWSDVQNNGITTTPAPTATWQMIIELNTGSADGSDIYFNYVDTDVGNVNFSSGGSATVGIKNAGTTNPPSDPLLVSFNQTNNLNLSSGTNVGIFQTATPAQTTTIIVRNVAPTFVNSTLTPGSVQEGVAFTRTVQFIDPSGQDFAGVVQPGLGDTFTVTVDWGDGSTTQTINIAAGSRSFDLSHIYRDDGTNTPGFRDYTITLQNFQDVDGATITPNRTITVTVNNVAPVLTLVTGNQLIAPGQTLVLDGTGGTSLIGNFTDQGVSFAPTGGNSGTRETFTATINWGDGTTETVLLPVATPANVSGTVTPATPLTNAQAYQPSTGTIGGRHRFNGVGNFTITVTIADDDTGVSNIGTFIVAVGSEQIYTVGADAGAAPLVRVFDSRLNLQYAQFNAYESTFTGGVRVAAGKINGDQLADWATAPGFGGGPVVKLYDGATRAAFAQIIAYDINFRGGCYVAVGDLNNDGFADIVTGAGQGGGPHVKAFSGRDGSLLFNGLVYDSAFRGGVSVAVADVNGDGFADIITAPGQGGGPHVKVFSGLNGALLNSFLAYDSAFRGGVFVAGGDVNGDGFADVITGPGVGGGPHLKVFDLHRNTLLFEGFPFPPGTPGQTPFTAGTLWQSGLRVGVTDFGVGNPPAGDGKADIIVGAGTGQQSLISILDGASFGQLLGFQAFDSNFLGGVFVGGNV